VKDGEAKAWARTRLKESKTTADDRVLTEIVRLVGTNLQTLYSELDKLAAAAIDTRQITMELVGELIDRSRELSNFALGDQLLTLISPSKLRREAAARKVHVCNWKCSSFSYRGISGCRLEAF